MLLGVFIFKKGDDGLSKFCTACGLPLQENVKFCTGCGAPVRSTEAGQEAEKAETVPKEPEQRTPVNVSPAFAQAAARLLPTSRAAITAGEMALPRRCFPWLCRSLPMYQVFWAVECGRYYRALRLLSRDRRRLIAALVLAVLWIIFIFLPPAVTDAVPAKLLSWLTFAQGGLQGGLLNKSAALWAKAYWLPFSPLCS
jgi:hypothetical protein